MRLFAGSRKSLLNMWNIIQIRAGTIEGEDEGGDEKGMGSV